MNCGINVWCTMQSKQPKQLTTEWFALHLNNSIQTGILKKDVLKFNLKLNYNRRLLPLSAGLTVV